MSTRSQEAVAVLLPSHAVAAVWFLTGAGPEPGSFVKALMSAISKADIDNRERLRTVYPHYVTAYEMGTLSSASFDLLVAIAKGTAS